MNPAGIPISGIQHHWSGGLSELELYRAARCRGSSWLDGLVWQIHEQCSVGFACFPLPALKKLPYSGP